MQNRELIYIRHEEKALYWEDTQAQEIVSAGTGSSRSPTDDAFIIIPKKSLHYVPKPDDKIFDGICTEAQPPKTALTIMSVKNFLYGSESVQHLEVRAK